jgi:hypothetical protein
MKKGRASTGWFVHRPVTESGVGAGVELGSSLYRLLLKREYTFVIVTHNMQQAARFADMT